MLNISYNVTRLARIIEEYHERKAYVKKRKSQLRGRPATDQEIGEMASMYLRGESLADISKATYRSLAFVKSIIEKIGIPSRVLEDEEWVAEYLPENCVADSFEIGEVVWSAKYHRPAIIDAELSVDYQAENLGFTDVNYEKKYSSKCYAIWVLQSHDEEAEDVWARVKTGGFNAFSLAYDLGKLEHLKQYGVTFHGTNN